MGLMMMAMVDFDYGCASEKQSVVPVVSIRQAKVLLE
jgi:hypothetical protein